MSAVLQRRDPDVQSMVYLARVVAFVANLGISVQIQESVSGFIDGVKIKDGGLIVSRNARPSNVLHEAGHLAVLPGQYRPYAQDDLESVFKMMFSAEGDPDPDSPLSRAVIQSGDPEATAWAWAVGKHLGLPDECIICDDEYLGGGAELRISLSMCRYCGINGLAHSGMTSYRYQPGPQYPVLKTWLQPVIPVQTRREAEIVFPHSTSPAGSRTAPRRLRP